jgi:HEAT repeat protein
MQRRVSPAPVRCLTLAVAIAGSTLVVFAESPARTDRRPSPEQLTALRKSLKDPAADVRQRAALALAVAHDADAIPVLIDLLAELPAGKRQPVEEFLNDLAGEEAPASPPRAEDGKGRRDAWAAWWRDHDNDTLLAAVRKQTPSAETRTRIAALLVQLGDDRFTRREKASKELFALGRVALPPLRDALKSSDPEVARRAGLLIERIEAAPAHHLSPATLRLLAVRKPAGAIDALLAYLPYAEDDSRSEETRKALAALARRDGKAAPELLRALSDARPLVRAAAAQALARGAGTEGRDAARKLLRDEVATVRLQAALALAVAQDPASVPVLIDLLAVLPADEAGQAEGILYQLAGDKAPRESLGTQESERVKCRDAWAAWWKTNAERVDLAGLSDRPLLGYTILCDIIGNRVYEIDRHGKQRWSIDNLQGPVDAWMLPCDRVLIAEFYGQRVTERDLKGNILWQKATRGHVINVQRLPNGHTFAVTGGGPIAEFDRTGKEVFQLNDAGQRAVGGYRFPGGPLVTLSPNGRCVLMDTAGKQLKSFPSQHDASHYGRIDLSPNGRILITQCSRKKVIEYGKEGQKLLEVDAPDICTASALPNGHILVACQEKQRAYELDRAGKIIWEHKNAGQVFRARRR